MNKIFGYLIDKGLHPIVAFFTLGIGFLVLIGLGIWAIPDVPAFKGHDEPTWRFLGAMGFLLIWGVLWVSNGIRSNKK